LAPISLLLAISFWPVREAVAASGPQAVLTPTSVLFADTAVGKTSVDQTVMVTNPGTATLKISSVTLTGADLDDFALTNACGKTLAKGKSCAIRVRFTPVLAGGFSAAVRVADNAAGLARSR
jgi:hypothetical protein